MHYNAQNFLLFAAGFLPAVLAQTSSNCNPLKGCKQDDPALGTTYTYDYTQNKAAAPQFDVVSSAPRISYQNDGMHMSVQMKGDSPTLQSKFYIFWGKIEVVMKAAPGQGVISSLVYQSDDLDEIDVEFVGSQPGNVQTNIFSKGNQDVHIYGGNSGVNDATGQFHTYTVDWTPTAITWYIDGVSARVLTRASLGDVYPQTPMQIKFGPWAAGDPSNPEGTRQWAGGDIDYSKAPFDMVVRSITITDYSTGATTYRYKDNSGSSESVEIVGGVESQTSSTPKTSSSAAPSTSAPPTTSTKPATTSTPKPTTTSVQSSTSEEPTTSAKPTTSTHSTKSTFSVISDVSSESAAPTGSSTLRTSAIRTGASTASASIPATETKAAGNSAASLKLSWCSLLLAAGLAMLL